MRPPAGSKRQTGAFGEEIAAAHLTKLGYRILEKNYRCPLGEIDMVAREGGQIVFVEVKSRRNEQYGDPQSAVDRKKQQKISMIAQYYLKEKRLYGRQARFDVLAVRLLPEGHRIELIRNAFEVAFGW